MSADLESLGERIAETAAHLDAAMHRLLTDLREFDAKGGWHRQGAATCAHWLSWRVGWELGTAREHTRVARALGELPRIDDALRLGQISYSKVRAMTRVATPRNELLLLEDAKLTTGEQLEKICRHYALVQRHDRDQQPKDDAVRRYVRKRDLADGMVRIEAVLHPDEAAIVWAALDRAAKELASAAPQAAAVDASAGTSGAAASDISAGTSGEAASDISAGTSGEAASDISAGTSGVAAGDVSAGTSGAPPAGRSAETCGEAALLATAGEPLSPAANPPPRARFDRADGLLAIAQQFARGDRPARSPIEVVVTVPATALRAGAPIDLATVGTLPDGDCIQPETARRLACDAGIVELVEDEHGRPLSVGRRTRALPAAIKRALIRRDRTCRFPGCTNHLYVEGHHVEHWADGGETALGNLVLLCSKHHRYVHEYGYRIAFDPAGEPVFVDARGRPATDVPPRPEAGDLSWNWILRQHRDLHITAETNAPEWDGEPVPYDDVVSYLARCDDGLMSPERIC